MAISQVWSLESIDSNSPIVLVLAEEGGASRAWAAARQGFRVPALLSFATLFSFGVLGAWGRVLSDLSCPRITYRLHRLLVHSPPH